MTKYKTPKIEELLEAGVHFGHQVRRWHPKMEPYIFTVKKNIHIIDLEQTEALLKEACDFLYGIAKNGGQIIFVGTKKQARDIIELEAKNSGSLYITERWIGGTITNYRIIKKNIDKLLNFIKRRETGDLTKYTKKERLLIDREIEKLRKYFGGITTLRGTPQALFVVDPKREKTAIKEALKYNVPIVALVDTNSDPTGIDYVIPGNDDAIKSTALILKSISLAVLEGYKDFENAGAAQKAAAAQETVAVEEPATVEPEKILEALSGSNVTKEVEKEVVEVLETKVTPISEDAPKEVETKKEPAKTKQVKDKKIKTPKEGK